MYDITQLPFLTNTLAFALTYLLHSAAWILLTYCLLKLPIFSTPLLKNYLWKGALIGGLMTSVLIHFSGNSLLEIYLGKSERIAVEPKQQSADEQLLLEVNKEYVVAREPNIETEETTVKMEVTPVAAIAENNSGNQTIIANDESRNSAEPSFKLMPFLLMIGLVVWLLGSIFFILKEGIRHYIFIKKIGKRTDINHPTVIYALHKISVKLKRKLPIILSQSMVLESPILIKNQEICLPERAIKKLDSPQMEAMLAHEIAHVMRKDYYWNCFLIVLDTLFFFQPLHRLAIKEIQTTNELLCDEWAAKVIGNNLALAQCLLTVATWMKKPTKTYPLVAGMSLKKSELSDRITSLINLPDMKKQRFNTLKVGLPFVALLAMALLILPGFTFTSLTDTVPVSTPPIKVTTTTNNKTSLVEPAAEPKNESQAAPIPTAVPEPAPSPVEEPTTNQKASADEFSTIGWGHLEDKVNERAYERTNAISREDFLPYLRTGNNGSGEFLPEKWGLKIPFYAQHSKVAYAPEFDPYGLDIPLQEKTTTTTNELVGASDISEEEAMPKEVIKTPTIRLEEKFAVNKNHPYFGLFQKTEQKAATEEDWNLDIKAIYYANLSCAGTTRSKIGGPLVTNKRDKNSLIFTLDYGDRIEYDTLQNCVHPPGHDNDGFAYNVKGGLGNWFGKQIYNATNNDIKGSHPAVVKSQWVQQSDNQKQTPMGIELLDKATVKIEVYTTRGKHVKTVADGVFKPGIHEFVFPHVNIKRGTYRLVSTVDGKTLSQNIKVKRTRFTHRKEKNSCAALLRAVKGNNIAEVKALVQTTSPNCEYREEGEPRSPLNAAARKGNVEIGRILLAANADVEFRARGDEGALMGAARKGHLDFVKLMVENGAKVNKTVHGDGTALINAVRGGHYEVAEYLLENGADPMLGVAGDENPIYHATKHGDDMLDLILKYRKRSR